MLELSLRLSLVGAALAVSAVIPGAEFVPSIVLAAILALVSFAGYLADVRRLRTDNVSLALAGTEIAAIAGWIASTGELSRYGVAILAPTLWAVVKHGVRPSSIAPIAAAAIPVANAFLGRLPIFSPAVLAPTAIVLAIGLMFELRPKAPRIQEAAAELPIYRDEPLTLAGDDYLQIRESYRLLRQRFQELERLHAQDQFFVKLYELRNRPLESLYPALAELVANLTGSDGAAILRVAESSNAMVVRGATTDFPEELNERAFPFDPQLGLRDMRIRLDSAVRAAPSSDHRDFANVLLLDDDRLLGVICVAQSDIESLRICREKTEIVAPQVVAFLKEEAQRESLTHRVDHVEMLYDLALAATEDGAADRMAARIARALDVDGVSLGTIRASGAEEVASFGATLTLLDSLNFDRGLGVEGWTKDGCPEVVMFDARNDPHCLSDAAVRRRVGSYYQAPLVRNSKTFGYLIAASHRAGGIDAPQVETLRLAAAEVARVLGGLVSEERVGDLLSPADFRRFVDRQSGCLVVLEVLHREQLALAHAKTDVDGALRKLQGRLRKDLPKDAAICRRDSGEFLAFLTDSTEEEAARWANDAAAGASFIGVPRIDGHGSTPLAVRAKVAQMKGREVGESARLSA